VYDLSYGIDDYTVRPTLYTSMTYNLKCWQLL